jgi:hypothetical protein
MTPRWFLYHHIPKCGGRSFTQACRSWFPSHGEDWGSFPDRAAIAECAKTRLDLTAFAPDTFFHGHYIYDGLRPQDRYPEFIAQGNLRLITVLRDPLERAMSAYFYRVKKGKNARQESLDDWMKKQRNRMARFLGVTAENWRPRLDGYFHVGTTELLPLTINVLARKTGNPPVPAPRLNTAERDDTTPSPESLEAFRRGNALDYALFAYATSRLQDEARSLGQQ